MKAILFLIFGAFALQVSAQGYHRSDGSYVIPNYRSYSDGYVYDTWYYIGYENVRRNNLRSSDSYNNHYIQREVIRDNRVRPATVREYNLRRTAINDKNIRRTTIRSAYYPPSNTYSSYYNTYPYNNNYYVTSEFLNVRSGASSNHSHIGTIYFGEGVNVLETYANGWMRIQYSGYDNFSSSYVNKYGYVAGNYLSPTNPKGKTVYTYNTYDNNVYSSIRKVESNYGIGGLCIWTNCGTDGDINVYLDDEYVGTLKEYFTNGIPKSGEDGTLLIEKPAGRYKLVAKGDNYSWTGTVQITRDKCLIQGLER